MRIPLLALTACAWACASPPPPPPTAATATSSAAAVAPAPPATTRVISVVGLNDFHGHVERLASFGGYVDRLRALRAKDGGVVVVDAGDMFQGTLDSNLMEGAAVIDGYNALGLSAAALGNHDFDYGPAGDLEPAAGVDPQGALRARLAQARFPVLSANLVETETGKRPNWKNLFASTLVEVGGVKVGLVGAITRETPAIVMRAYFAGLDVVDSVGPIDAEAQALRGRGARVVVAVVHAGGNCTKLDDPHATDSCDMGEEIARVARELPQGSVDVIVAGHTHNAVAHFSRASRSWSPTPGAWRSRASTSACRRAARRRSAFAFTLHSRSAPPATPRWSALREPTRAPRWYRTTRSSARWPKRGDALGTSRPSHWGSMSGAQ